VPLKGKQAQHGMTYSKYLSPFAHEKVLYKVLEDLKEIKAGHYAQPLNDQEPAMNAFCVSEGLPWEDVTPDPVTLIFQMTVARKHQTQGQPIKHIIDYVHRADGSRFDPQKNEVYLVFIVEYLLKSAQHYLTKSKSKPLEVENLGTLKKIKQRCLQIE